MAREVLLGVSTYFKAKIDIAMAIALFTARNRQDESGIRRVDMFKALVSIQRGRFSHSALDALSATPHGRVSTR